MRGGNKTGGVRLPVLRGILPISAAQLTSAIAAPPAPPMQTIMGSFFPSWILCAVAGVIGMVAVRQVLVLLHVHENLPVPLLTYLAVALIIACAVWLVFFIG
jgi:hypothetical protein